MAESFSYYRVSRNFRLAFFHGRVTVREGKDTCHYVKISSQ